jgi:hypothetical protein
MDNACHFFLKPEAASAHAYPTFAFLVKDGTSN